MLIVMNAGATKAEVADVIRVIEALGFRAHPMPGATRTAIGVTGNQGAVDLSHFENLPGVAEAIRVTKPYKLITLDLRPDRTVVDVGGAKIGDGSLAIIAGPCAVESREQAFAVAKAVQQSGAQFFRGGAFKPRTSPYSFAGLGEEALKILAEVREKFALKIVSEALDDTTLDLIERYADMIQIGARNMQNFTLLKHVGRSRLPVLLKRGMAATLEEWLLAAEYVMAEGNYQIVLCERGVRTFAQHTRNTLDLAAVPAVRHLPAPAWPSVRMALWSRCMHDLTKLCPTGRKRLLLKSSSKWPANSKRSTALSRRWKIAVPAVTADSLPKTGKMPVCQDRRDACLPLHSQKIRQ
jgi:3-deoxy-7-phosphoheptulonate synthase